MAENTVADDTDADYEDQAAMGELLGQEKLNLGVEIKPVGPCRKHVTVTVPEADIARFRDRTLEMFAEEVKVPGFRQGRVPLRLIEKRFQKEILAEVKQKLLLASLAQVTEDHDLDPIDEPELEVANLEVPVEGDFEYEFNIEVRPTFDLPNYRGLQLKRPVHDVTEADIDQHVQLVRENLGTQREVDAPVVADLTVDIDVAVRHEGQTIREFSGIRVRVRNKLQFQDAEMQGFATLMTGATKGEKRTGRATVSLEASDISLRGEEVDVDITVNQVIEIVPKELGSELFARFDATDEASFRASAKAAMERQVAYRQREQYRDQILAAITGSSTWELPEGLLRKHVDNALRREILEMQQAGFPWQTIAARENQIRQQSVTETRQAMKEHFVLDRIAKEENIETSPEDIEREILYMAYQRGESPRAIRSRLVKSGMIENLQAQIRERRAVEFIQEHAQFVDEPISLLSNLDVAVVQRSICPEVGDVDLGNEQDDD